MKLNYWGTPDLSSSARLGGGAGKHAHRTTRTEECTAPARCRSCTGMHCAWWHRHTYTVPNTPLARHRQTSALVSSQSQLSNKAEKLCRDCIPICQKKDVSLMLNGLLKREWPFFPLLGYTLAFSESALCTWVTTASWQVMEPEWASNKTASRIYKY